jgi:hypothetical protein
VGDRELIEQYLAELDAALRLPGRTRRRIVAEARDHLDELAGAQGARAAIDAFGNAAAVADRFARELAFGSTRRAGRRSAVMLALALVLWDLCTSSFVHLPAGWVTQGALTPLLFLIGQVGLVAGVVSLVRVHAAQRGSSDTVARLRYAIRGIDVLVACSAITVVLVAASVLGEAMRGTAHLSAFALLGLGVACAAFTAASALSTWRAHRRIAAIDGVSLPATGREVLVDLRSLAASAWVRVSRGRSGVRPGSAGAPRWTRAASLARRLDPYRHPWRYGLVVALIAGCLVPLLDFAVLLINGAANASNLVQLALDTPLLIGAEAAAAFLGYATLGGYLGLRPTGRRAGQAS